MDAVQSGKNEVALVYLEKILAQRLRRVGERSLRKWRVQLGISYPRSDQVLCRGRLWPS
ncbi:MAG: hypothetical protein CM1200mP24_03690 [Gammaproteobacteria bacterium]|nr:MAG: hypothetical protein CM1200mP24_03690 [Gammaproteobacteria bacterium]